jgi:3-deoxy-D-manno-octulosonate 8-phosphate phosphatase KdsC-like HAD superfamily phosphatase
MAVVITQSSNSGKNRIQQVATANIYIGMMDKNEVLKPLIHSMECADGNTLEIPLKIVF